MTVHRTGGTDIGMLRRGMRVIVLALRSAPGPFSIGIGGAALYAGMTVAASVVLGRVTDEVILPAFDAGAVDRGLLALAVAAVLGVATFKAVGVVGRRLGAYIAQYRLQARYRRRVTRRYLELPLIWHRRHSTGELLSNANADVESAFFVAAPLPMAVGASLLLIVTAALLVAADPALAVIGFSVGPVLALANWYYQRRMRHAATVAQQARAEVSEVAHESFDAGLVIKTMGREGAETARFAATAEDLRDKVITVGRLRAFFDPVIEALPNIGILLVLVVGAYRVRAGALTPGDLVQFAYLFRLVALPMRVFGRLLGELPRAVVAWDRVQGVLSATGDMRYGSERAGGQHGASVSMDAVGFLHPTSEREHLAGPSRPDVSGRTSGPDGSGPDGRRGIASVTFDVAAGRTIALVGATGSGKSTVAALLTRLYDPDTGQVELDRAALPEVGRDELADNVAIVFQDAFLFDDTVEGNITLGRDYTDEQVRAAARLARADGFIRELDEGYATSVGERGATLSGGQRQRIALARALIRRPRLLVLDDATSAVDPSVEAEILRGLATAALPSTVVVVAYRRASIALADEVVFLRDGVVAARGSHAQLLEREPAYAQLVSAYERTEAQRQQEAQHQDVAVPGDGQR